MQLIDDRETYDVANVSGGIQSTTLAHAIFNNDMPRPDCFIFADTGWERQSNRKSIPTINRIVGETASYKEEIPCLNLRLKKK